MADALLEKLRQKKDGAKNKLSSKIKTLAKTTGTTCDRLIPK